MAIRFSLLLFVWLLISLPPLSASANFEVQIGEQTSQNGKVHAEVALRDMELDELVVRSVRSKPPPHRTNTKPAMPVLARASRQPFSSWRACVMSISPCLFHQTPYSRLIAAIKNDKPQAVLQAIAEGAQFMTISCEEPVGTAKYTPIELAVMCKSIRALEAMLNTFGVVRPPALVKHLQIRAVQSGHVEMVKWLLNYGVLDFICDLNPLLIHHAITHHASKELMALLLDHYSMCDQVESPEVDQDSVLHLAIRFSHPVAFVMLIKRGASLVAQNAKGLQPLELLARLERDSFVRKVAQMYHNLGNLADAEGNTLTHHAAKVGNVRLLNVLLGELKCPANPQNSDKKTPLMLAMDNQQLEVIEYFFAAEKKPFSAHLLGGIVLELVIQMGREEGRPVFDAIIFGLKTRRSKVDTVHWRSLTQALLESKSWWLLEQLLPHLLQLGEQRPDFHDLKPEPLLSELISFDCPRLLELCFEEGIVTRDTQPPTFYQSALHEAAQHGHFEIIKLLLNHDAPLETPTASKSLLLDLVIHGENMDILRHLLSVGKWEMPCQCSLQVFKALLLNGWVFSGSRAEDFVVLMPDRAIRLFTDLLHSVNAEASPRNYESWHKESSQTAHTNSCNQLLDLHAEPRVRFHDLLVVLMQCDLFLLQYVPLHAKKAFARDWLLKLIRIRETVVVRLIRSETIVPNALPVTFPPKIVNLLRSANLPARSAHHTSRSELEWLLGSQDVDLLSDYDAQILQDETDALTFCQAYAAP